VLGASYLNAFAREKIMMVGKKSVGESGTLRQTWKDLDWLFGPFAFRKEWSGFWLNHEGEMWDAQILPMVYAIRSGATTISVDIAFRASSEMKKEEEGNLKYVQKRKYQLDELLVEIEKSFYGPVPDYTHAERAKISDAAKILA